MIRDFIAQVKTKGLSRSNRYAVKFTPPSSIRGESLKNILLLCDQAILPGVNYATVQNRTFGEFREIPYEKLYDQCTLSFYVDTELQVKRLFDGWVNQVQNPTTRTFNYYNDYICDMVIEVQDLNDKTRYQMILYECYPKSISNIQLDYASKDVMKVQVQIMYKHYTTTPINTLASGETVSTSMIGDYMNNFTGFQERFNKSLGEALNFTTGAVINYGVTKLPGLLRF
jgi:hypothetical protein